MKRKPQRQQAQRRPPAPSPEESFRKWVAALVEKKDLDALAMVLDVVQEALQEVEEAIDKEQEPEA